MRFWILYVLALLGVAGSGIWIDSVRNETVNERRETGNPHRESGDRRRQIGGGLAVTTIGNAGGLVFENQIHDNVSGVQEFARGTLPNQSLRLCVSALSCRRETEDFHAHCRGGGRLY